MKVTNEAVKSSYTIRFSKNIKDFLDKQKRSYTKIAIVSDTNIWALYRKTISSNSLLNINIKPGEKSKSIETKNHIEEELLKNKFNRKSLIVAIGGGVVGDLSGYTASTFMRGIDLVHIPTSLVAIVDSSIGGKTAIDNKYGKNLIGTFYNPKEIIINMDFLLSLPKKEIRQGMAEIIKYSIIDDEELFSLLGTINKNFLSNKKNIIMKIIKKCIQIKVKTIKEDFKEGDKRMILNFGHTVGHAIEKLYNYSKSHGDCIGLGMLVEAKIAHDIKALSITNYSRIKELLLMHNLLKIKLNKSDTRQLLSFMRLDKKNSDKKITFSIPQNIGKMKTTKGKHSIQVNDKIILNALNKVIDEIKN